MRFYTIVSGVFYVISLLFRSDISFECWRLMTGVCGFVLIGVSGFKSTFDIFLSGIIKNVKVSYRSASGFFILIF